MPAVCAIGGTSVTSARVKNFRLGRSLALPKNVRKRAASSFWRASVADNENEVVGGYRLMRHMWTGQESQVWEVAEPASGRHFAMKILLPEKADDSAARR